MKPKKIIFSLILILLVTIGITFSIVHQNQVKADRIAQERRKTEDKNLKTATAAVDTAFKTREDQDIKSAETAVSKLNTRQKAEKNQLTKKLNQLKEFLKQVSDVDVALSKAMESKVEQDIQTVQSLIDKETDDYLKTDKTSAQNKLDALIAQIAKEKADAQTEQAASETSQQAETVAQTSTYVEAPQQTYQAPEQTNSGNAYTPPTQSASGGDNNYTPPTIEYQKPDGTPNSAGIIDSPGGTDPVGGWQWIPQPPGYPTN